MKFHGTEAQNKENSILYFYLNEKTPWSSSRTLLFRGRVLWEPLVSGSFRFTEAIIQLSALALWPWHARGETVLKGQAQDRMCHRAPAPV